MTMITHYKATFGVRYWREIIFGEELGLSADYLSDRSVPWSSNAFEVVLRPHDALPEEVISLDDRLEIVAEIAEIFTIDRGACFIEMPMVHFKGQDVHVTVAQTILLESLWREQPKFRGQKMKLVSKGFPKNNVKVYKVLGLQAKARNEVVASLRRMEEGLVSAAIASLYIIFGSSVPKYMQEEVVRDGDMLIFGSAALQGKNTFFGSELQEVVYPKID